MSNKRGQAGRIGISGNASVSMEKIAGENEGDPVPLPADENDNLLLAKMVGEDDNGDFQRVATDQNGRIKVKDVQFDGTVDIGDLQVMNTSETKINPATEGTVSSLLSESVFKQSQNTSDELLVDIATDTVGLLTENTFQQSQNASDEIVVDIATNTANLLEQGDTVSVDSLPSIPTGNNNIGEVNIAEDIFLSSDFTETRTISQNNAGLFEASDFTEDRNVRELQNESSVTSGTHSGGGSLPSNPVPDGKSVSVKAQFGNTGAVQVNGDYPLLEGDSVELQVQNTDQISYTTDNGTEGVAFIVEG
jgi:hypothetical protein